MTCCHVCILCRLCNDRSCDYVTIEAVIMWVEASTHLAGARLEDRARVMRWLMWRRWYEDVTRMRWEWGEDEVRMVWMGWGSGKDGARTVWRCGEDGVRIWRGWGENLVRMGRGWCDDVVRGRGYGEDGVRMWRGWIEGVVRMVWGFGEDGARMWRVTRMGWGCDEDVTLEIWGWWRRFKA